MQVVCLNTWAGRAYDALAGFILGQRQATDVFCFQEVLVGGRSDPTAPVGAPRSGMYHDLCSLLPEFAGFFTPMQRRTSSDAGASEYGLATFVRRTITVAEAGQVPLMPSDPGSAFVWEGWESVLERPLQYCRLQVAGRELRVANVHGTPAPPHKRDTPERIEQSRRIAHFLASGPRT